MIVSRLCGGLGNQLFQYAAGRRLAQARGVELILDLGWFDRHSSSNTQRVYELDNYAIEARKPSVVESLWCRLHQGRILRRLPLLPRRWKHYREKNFAFDSRLSDLQDDTYIDGYWQSYKYFVDISSQIRSELTPKKLLVGQDRFVAEQISKAKGQAVSLHVRRGDYVTNPAAARTHGLCGDAYYIQSVEAIESKLRDPHFFVFSDDMPWVRSKMALPGKVTYVEHNGPATAFRDLQLMSLCDHHVIANSSFSWWGAWLSGRDDGCVIAPANWFADGRKTEDLTPGNWIRL